MSHLVIVESPAKAKTIEKYLGKDYSVVASVGHIRDLPKSKLGVDIENGFEPQYENKKEKSSLIKELKKDAKESDIVYLATDPDREGEAISWHLAHVLGIKPDAPVRVTFSEITKSGIEAGMSHPRTLDMDLINAQQARRILDRIVGYKLSPFLWKKVRRGLSAGRVQSVAVRIIVDREQEIESFKPQEYWSIDAKLLSSSSKRAFPAKLIEVGGEKFRPTTGTRKASGRRVCHYQYKEQHKKKDARTPVYHLYLTAGGVTQALLQRKAHNEGGAGAVRGC